MVFINLNILKLGNELTIIVYSVLTIVFILFQFKSKIMLTFFSMLIILKIAGLNRFFLENYGTNILSDLVTLILIVLIFFDKKNIKFSQVNIYLLSILFLFGLTYIILGSINSNAILMLSFLKSYLSNIILFFISIVIFNRFSMEYIKKIMQIISIYIASIIIFQWNISATQFNLNEYFLRGEGILGNSNLAGTTVAIFTILIFHNLLKKYSHTDGLIFILLLISLLITQSRSSLLVTILVLTLSIIFSKKNYIKKSIFSIGYFLMFIILFKIFLNYFPSYSSRIDISNENFDNARFDALLVGIANINSSFFGVGIGKSSENLLNLSSHNFYVHSLSEAGILLLPFLILLLMSLFWKINRKNNVINNTNYLLIFLILISFFTHIIMINPLYYFILALIFTDILKEREV